MCLNSFLLRGAKCKKTWKDGPLSESCDLSAATGQSSNTAGTSGNKPGTLSFTSRNSRHFNTSNPVTCKMFVLSNPRKPSEFLLQQSEGLATAQQTKVHLICSEITPQAELALTENNQVQGIFLKHSSDFKESKLHCPKCTCRCINMHSKALWAHTVKQDHI